MKAIERRIAAVERHVKHGALQAIIVTGGLPGPAEPMYATAGERTWQRGEGEPFAVFRQRVQAGAIADDVETIVLGGLPG